MNQSWLKGNETTSEYLAASSLWQNGITLSSFYGMDIGSAAIVIPGFLAFTFVGNPNNPESVTDFDIKGAFGTGADELEGVDFRASVPPSGLHRYESDAGQAGPAVHGTGIGT